MRPRVAAAALVVVALGAAAPTASAEDEDEVTVRSMAFAERGGDLVVSTRFGELIDDAAVARLASGLPTTVVVRVYVYRRDREELPVAVAAIQLEVVYDLWDDVYLVRTADRAGVRTARFPNRAAAVAAVGRLDGFAIAPLARLAVGAHHVAGLIAELNPVSDELQAEMRRWLVQPAGGRLDAGSSFFGSFVSVFVNPRIGAADRIVRLRSQPFYRTARVAP